MFLDPPIPYKTRQSTSLFQTGLVTKTQKRHLSKRKRKKEKKSARRLVDFVDLVSRPEQRSLYYFLLERPFDPLSFKRHSVFVFNCDRNQRFPMMAVSLQDICENTKVKNLLWP